MLAAAARTARAMVRLGRPRFLVAGVVLYGVGVAAAALQGVSLDLRRLLLGQLLISAAQLMTQYCNDYYDLEADRANATPTRWSGGSRVLVTGALPRWAAMVAAIVLAVVALLAAAGLAFLGGTPRAAPFLGVIIVALAWEYSAPPLRLETRGLGELDTALVVAVLTPLFGYYLQYGRFTGGGLLVVLPLALFQFAMLIAIEFPDAAGDTVAGKRTLVVRYGAISAARLHAAAICGAFALIPILVAFGLPRLAALALLAVAPLGLWQVAAVLRGHSEPRRWPGIAFRGVALLILGAVAALAGLAAQITWG